MSNNDSDLLDLVDVWSFLGWGVEGDTAVTTTAGHLQTREQLDSFPQQLLYMARVRPSSVVEDNISWRGQDPGQVMLAKLEVDPPIRVGDGGQDVGVLPGPGLGHQARHQRQPLSLVWIYLGSGGLKVNIHTEALHMLISYKQTSI